MANFRTWFEEHLADSAADLAEHGADAGFPCITYNSDCVELFDKFGDELWWMLTDAAEDQGVTIPALIATFGRVDMAETLPGFKTLIVWFGCEQLARERETEQPEPAQSPA